MININKLTEKMKPGSETREFSDSEIIEFVCEKRDYGVIPDPIPANKVLPEWYRNLEGKLGEGLNQSTVKRCMPFMDALTMGWIIPLAAEVEFAFDPETTEYSYSWNYYKDIISKHDPNQIGGDKHPLAMMPVLKFHNFWAMKVPEDYSVLVTSPLNRVEKRFQTFSGLVDADHYFNFINAPFIWTGGEFHGVLEKGTPIVQVIPIKRGSMIGDASVRSMTVEEKEEEVKTSDTIDSEFSNYRNSKWQPKPGTRIIEKE